MRLTACSSLKDADGPGEGKWLNEVLKGEKENGVEVGAGGRGDEEGEKRKEEDENEKKVEIESKELSFKYFQEGIDLSLLESFPNHLQL